MNTLHYIYDPLCGWCYAAAPLIDAAHGVEGLKLALHAGGMLAGANRRAITPQWRDYVMPHDRRIAQLSGQPFGEAYFEGLLRDTTAVMDSAPPATAILAAEALAGRGLEMLHALQHTHYVEGRRIAEREVINALAQQLGLDAEAFDARYAALENGPTSQHFHSSREWLARVGGQGFPTLALEAGDGTLTRVEAGEWLGRPTEFAAALRAQLGLQSQATTTIAQCGPDGCAI
ncbi:MAG: protein-disulfide isomerase [Candidatus Dactylopiibacterium carminicum]|uniref:Protein-disulfide isomerase n=1 Tax=Candidatus Dactylopiibacterium carminicum TaxID=857335 RepID=A0A272EXA8_9RHOO|nr:DsbA family protein [Candidatus Dactylopiibacterium carminicum]KAF7600231.1 protein-disulfide isomerase [Candidatus Dactylopiibacterium carminicum]PAS94752.1 MAG: protein-disulfide isomerase [Candidatus Dactylopiibacterium carminicum]PAS97678.1 MAG: protein-disulfide isomerase [Candidatus Dactylopiibacterium carminicum]PAT00225.1 MAG: protein-disulfide isomerase [Candidatus Dactylopiibacterium carminicum]